MKTKLQSASARWDTATDPTNPGWVVDIVTLDGRQNTLAPAPAVYHLAPGERNAARVVRATLAWESMSIEKGEK